MAQSFVIGEEFIDGDSCALVLGDNIFYGAGFGDILRQCHDPQGGVVFAYPVADRERFGLIPSDYVFSWI